MGEHENLEHEERMLVEKFKEIDNNVNSHKLGYATTEEVLNMLDQYIEFGNLNTRRGFEVWSTYVCHLFMGYLTDQNKRPEIEVYDINIPKTSPQYKESHDYSDFKSSILRNLVAYDPLGGSKRLTSSSSEFPDETQEYFTGANHPEIAERINKLVSLAVSNAVKFGKISSVNRIICPILKYNEDFPKNAVNLSDAITNPGFMKLLVADDSYSIFYPEGFNTPKIDKFRINGLVDPRTEKKPVILQLDSCAGFTDSRGVFHKGDDRATYIREMFEKEGYEVKTVKPPPYGDTDLANKATLEGVVAVIGHSSDIHIRGTVVNEINEEDEKKIPVLELMELCRKNEKEFPVPLLLYSGAGTDYILTSGDYPKNVRGYGLSSYFSNDEKSEQHIREIAREMMDLVAEKFMYGVQFDLEKNHDWYEAYKHFSQIFEWINIKHPKLQQPYLSGLYGLGMGAIDKAKKEKDMNTLQKLAGENALGIGDRAKGIIKEFNDKSVMSERNTQFRTKPSIQLIRRGVKV